MKKHIAVLAGDGIGPEITAGAVAVLQKVAQKYQIGRASCRERVLRLV